MVEKTGIRLDRVSFKIGEFAFEDISLTINDGEYFVLTGPNGAGKTMLIKLIAGLKRPESGDIFIIGKNVTEVPPWQRSIGYVPQEFILFPNLTVKANIEFGLTLRKLDLSQIKERVNDVAAMLDIQHLLERSTNGLSAGEQQKVSIARALVINPSVLLLDEPMSSIDEDFRDALCEELKKLHRETRITTIHVSHNKKETKLVADRVGYMINGKFNDTAGKLQEN